MGNTLKTTLLLAVLTVLFVLVGNAIGGQSGMIFAFGLAIVMNVGSYWFSDKIVLRMYNAREVTEAESPQLHGMVRRIALAAGVPMPKVYIIPQESPQRLRDRTRPGPRGGGGDGGDPAVALPGRTGRRAGPRDGARAEPGHPDRHRGGHPGRGDHDAGQHGALRRDLRRREDDREGGGGGLQLLVMAILAPSGRC